MSYISPTTRSTQLNVYPRCLSLLERAKRNIMRRKACERAEGTRQFRKFEALQTRREIAEKTNQASALPASGSLRILSVSLVTSPPTHSTPSPLSISPSSITLTLAALKLWRENNASTLTYLKGLETRRANREAKRQQALQVPDRQWSRLDEFERVPVYARVMVDHPNCISFTLNLSPDVLAMAGKAKGGLFDHIRRRVTRELTKALGESPRLLVALDATTTGRLHLHGLVIGRRDQALAIDAALRRAGGEWASGRGREHQAHLAGHQWELINGKISATEEALSPAWGLYCIKEARELKAQAGTKVVYASPDLKKLSEVRHETTRPSNDGSSSINTDLTPSKTVFKPLEDETEIKSDGSIGAVAEEQNNANTDRRLRNHVRNPFGPAEQNRMGRGDGRRSPDARLRHPVRSRRYERPGSDPLSRHPFPIRTSTRRANKPRAGPAG